MQGNPNSINSRLWWEEYFAEDWDSHGGGDQTRYSMQRLLDELPLPEAAFMRSRTLTILDWGCAFGEGVEWLAQAFPQSQVAGLDFASTAIEQARRRHPKREFILAENGEIPTEFDVIITSNCLEHFEQPLEIVTTHLRSCRELYIALVPYDEFPLSESHRFRFKEDSFPERIGDRVRVCARTIEVAPPFWNGNQLLVVYGSQSYLSECRAAHDRGSEQEKWDSYYATLPLYDADETVRAFNAELVERVSELVPIGSRILEAGCGGGWHSLALAKTGNFHITLMDFSREALAYSRRLFDREKLSAQFICEDVFAHGKPDFDLVFNTGVLEHYSLKQQEKFLRSMASRSRNYVLALVPNRLCYWYWIWRVHKSGKGEWPFGKEVPLTDFSAAFDLAGLEFLGQTVMGKRWTEFFISDLAGMDRNLRDQILEIHRSSIIPEQQQGYLLAALGSVSSKPVKGPKIWMPPTVPEDLQKAEIIAALADALALRIGAEHGLSQQRAKALENEQTAQMLIGQTADKEQALQWVFSESAERDKCLHALTADLVAMGRELEALSSKVALKDQAYAEMSARMLEKEHVTESLLLELAEKKGAIESLASRIAETEQRVHSLSSQLAEKERTANDLSEQLSTKDYELGRMTNTLAWRLLSRYGRIKYRYLLPVYRVLGLPPYGKKQFGATQTNLLETPSDHGQPAQLADSTVGIRTSTGHVQRKMGSRLSCESNAHDVVCFPIIDWDFRFQRPQQLMSRFAAAGHRVFYIAQTFYPSGPAYTLQGKGENIFEISFRGPAKNVYGDMLDQSARDVVFASLDELRRDLMLGATVSFVQLPFWWPLADKARAEFGWPVVYDCMDDHSGFSTNKQLMLSRELDLLESADLVAVSSELLQTRALKHNSNVLLLRNACDYEHFARVVKSRNERPVIGYYGAIADWFDTDLVADLAQRRPDWDFVLVGSTFSADTSRLSTLSNVSLPGEKHYSEIPGWVSKFDVVTIPFKRNALTEATNPVKLYEILSSGKPLVSVPIPEVKTLAPLVRLASSAKQFESEIRAALDEDDPSLVEKRRAFARDHTWERRYETLARPVRELFPKASIIIVTFNNVGLNRLCLESLYARTEWPTFEVIVVDNASADGTRQYLREAERVFPNLQVTLNEKNLGFAAANNIGLKQATGQYLVFLNNDTVLTRGWLSTLIRHLHADPEIGIVGPVTNEIGNEAKVPVGYKQLEEMPYWAASFVRENDSRVFPIRVLAMFCVAMRREVFRHVGFLDENFEIGMFEDDDYARRVSEKGYKVVCARDSFIHHFGGASFKLLTNEKYLEIFDKNRRTYEQKWGIWEPHMDERSKKRVPGLITQLRRIVKHSGIDRSRVAVFLPSIGWNSPLTQRPQHIARELAREGFLVFFDCAGSIMDHFSEFRMAEKNLWLYKGPVGVLENLDNPIVWALPYNASLVDRWSRARVVYDFIDDLSVFPYEEAELRKNHGNMLDRADLVLCVAQNLIDQVRDSRPDAVYAPNAVDFELFSSSPANDLSGLDIRFRKVIEKGRPVAGYYGAIASWLDAELLTRVAQERTDWNFVLIGQKLPNACSLDSLEKLPNVLVLRPQPYTMLPSYLQHFTAAMIPFKINQITESTSPIKLYEYLAAGKPVICTPMPECQAFQEVLVARDAGEFSRALDASRALSGDSEFQTKARAVGRTNSWAARLKMVLAELSKRPERNNAREIRIESKPPEQGDDSDYEEAVDGAGELAKRFSRFRTHNNRRFFEALANYFASIADDPRLPMYFEFAITCNARGRFVADLLRPYTGLRGKKYMDIGCAYGGFLVAFAQEGAEVIGVDIDESLLHLAEYNLMDNGIDPELLARDAGRASDLVEFHDSFDIITCNDVIEHAEDPQALLCNISYMLREKGIVYFEIPNRYYPRFVLQDGHYNLFGITLLEYPEAREYYSLHLPGTAYTVRHYLELDQYKRLFEQAGLRLSVMEETLEHISPDSILNDVAELRSKSDDALGRVPAPVRERVREALTHYLDQVESAPRATESQKRDFKLRYGISFWRVLSQK